MPAPVDTRGTSTVKCPACGSEVPRDRLRTNLYVCPSCKGYLNMPAHNRIEMLADPRSFREVDRGLVSVDPLRFTDQRSYRERLAEARARTGLREAVVVGQARIEGRRIVLGVFDFEFMGGTMGSVVGEKVADAFEYAARRRLPVVIVSASGGARMQEGMLSLMQMAKTSVVLAELAEQGIPFVSILTNPTTGGVSASYAMQGDVIIAEPGAVVGFAGPRVIKQTIGQDLPEGFQTSEFLLDHGMIDAVVPRSELRETTAQLLRHMAGRAPVEAGD